jgi:fructose-bisphosphate aldolase class 1
LVVWAGKESNFKEAQNIFIKRVEENCLADQGK